MSDPSPRAANALAAVPGDNPAGQQISDDPEFEALRGEVMKDPVRGQVIDWKKVVPLATELLQKRSKDFTVASYLAVALLETDRYAGLADGLQILEGLIQTFWDNGYPSVPKRLRGRANSLLWMSERAGKWVERRGAEVRDREGLAHCVQICTDLDKALAERFPDGDVGVGALSRSLREALERLPAEMETVAQTQEAAAPLSGASSAVGGVPASAPALAPSGSAPADGLEVRSQSDALILVFKIAAFLRQSEPSNPAGFRLVRALRWSGIEELPPANAGKTQLIPPHEDTVLALRRLHDAGNWAGLLEEAESSFQAGSPLWLDLHRYSAAALAGLGDAYASAREGVHGEVRALLRRLPQLADLRFRDDTPFADAETRRWLTEDLGAEPAPASVAAAPAATPAGVDEALLSAARQAARKLVKSGDMRGALEALSAVLPEPGTLRGDFLARLEVAVLFAESGRERLAAPLLEALDETLRGRTLEEWDPALAARVLQALYRCSKRLAGQRGATPALAERVEEIYARLCRLDPAAAAALD